MLLAQREVRGVIIHKKIKRIYDDVIVHPRHFENLETATRLIRKLHVSDSLDELYSLQQELLEAIFSAEDEQRKAKDRKKDADRAYKAFAEEGKKRSSVDKARLQELQQESDKHGLEVEVLRRVRRQLRSVGDGLLWKAVGFNRAYVYAVSSAPGEGNTFLSGPEGLSAELEVVEHLWKTKGALAVMHDLTNYGKVGDLTVVSLTESIKLMEVKASPHPVDPKQIERIAEAVRFVRGAPKAFENDYAVQVSALEGASYRESARWELDNWGVYAQAIADAGTKGLGWATVGNYLGLVAVNSCHPSWEAIITPALTDEERKRLHDKAFAPAYRALAEAITTGQQDVVSEWDSSEKYEENILGAPFSIYPLSPSLCAALACDYIKLVVYLNVTNFCRHFEHRGFEVLAVPKPTGRNQNQFFIEIYLSRPKYMRDGTQKMLRVHLGRPLMQQVLGEAMSVETVMKAVQLQMRGEVKDRSDVSLLFLDSKGRRYVVTPPANRG